ncbi:uncharacterized protein H6S33_012801 [Morchella sextelata]|uniref:uncharacterized protein n=1 Tax=Morchella sextelata TaxID=1174677 RepID=UPI001D053A1E|nr:uncharacterized protein H6S33_012801 [Morchella sextelata]KAH0609315.1 hypothetical protein H6S33_012801 [Morchella sextelata]
MSGMGATFYPGNDDYMMPELNIVSPAPQRVMPEVPGHITDSLKHLEIDGSNMMNQRNQGNYPQGNYVDPYSTPSQGRPLSDDRGVRSSYASSYHSSIGDDYRFSGMEDPVFSPFPRLINPGPNIPPTDEEKEAQIEGARLEVLSSNDPEMQLIWAQDALSYVEVSVAYHNRIYEGSERPMTPALEHQIKTDAISVVSFLADQHHPRAEFMRGNWLEFGKFGFRIDKKEAFRCYARAAEKDFARAEYRMGMQFENSNEPMKAIKHYNQGANLGDSASNYRLGMMTLLGQHGQKQDYARGVNLIKQAANTADENAPQGAYVYGMLLARELPGIEIPDLFLPLDIRQAREMIEKAAFLGFARAQLKMGTAYELCQLGCDFNPALSLHYNALAARQGEPEADMAISKWFLCGHEGVFDKNEELAFKYAQRAAAAGLGTAEFAIGYFYEIGMYVQVDYKEAQRWYAKAAAHGNKDASGRIDGISRSKTLSRKDHEAVAISKIKARHGSQRLRNNPLTERQQSAAAPIMSPLEEAVDMPDPTIPGGNYNYNSGPPPGQRPTRQATMPNINPGFISPEIASHLQPFGVPQSPAQARPGSAAPYPLSGPGPGPGPHPRGPGAFVMGGGPPPGMIPPAGTYPAGPPRPFTAMSDSSPSRRPSGAGGQPYGPPQQQGYPPHSPEAGYPGGFNGETVPRIHTPKPPGLPSGPAPVNIGFEAPERPKPSKTAPPSGPIAPPPSTTSNSGRPGTSQGSAPPRQQQQQQQQPMAPQHGGGQAGHELFDGPPTPTNKTQRPTTAESTPKPVSAPLPKPPGKGPKTFEDMGVPQAPKQDGDCIIM